jgi:dihydrofolate reductase
MDMAKVIAWTMVTLDGFFEGEKQWDLGFHSDGWSDELNVMSQEFGAKAGLLMFGRVTYEGMKSYWTTTSDEDSETTRYMNALPKLVASRTLTASDWNNTRMTSDPVGEITRLRKEPGKDIYIFGSADLTDGLLKAGLIDELMLGIVPVTLGKGNPFLKQGGEKTKFTLIEARPLKSGTVIVRYTPQNVK